MGQFHSKTTSGCRPTIFDFPENLHMRGVKAEIFNGDVKKITKNYFTRYESSYRYELL